MTKAIVAGQHTPGPWSVQQGNCGRVLGLHAPTGAVALLGVAEYVRAEDAALIAASPTLFASLRLALSVLVRCDAGSAGNRELWGAIEQARDALDAAAPGHARHSGF